jgi:hypothetical protein
MDCVPCAHDDLLGNGFNEPPFIFDKPSLVIVLDHMRVGLRKDPGVDGLVKLNDFLMGPIGLRNGV